MIPPAHLVFSTSTTAVVRESYGVTDAQVAAFLAETVGGAGWHRDIADDFGWAYWSR